MDAILLLKGIMIGVLMSFPFGPTGLLCINRTLTNGRTSGFLSGMGSATGDTIFVVIAGFGVSYLVHFIEAGQFYFHLLGSAIIILLGIRIFISNPVKKFRYRNQGGEKRVWHYFSGMFLALSNPFILFAFLAVFATFNLLDKNSFMPAISLTGGFFLGATAWWFFISSVVNRLRDRLRLRGIFWLNRIAGAAIFIFGFAAIIGVLMS